MSLCNDIMKNIGVCETVFPFKRDDVWNEELKQFQQQIICYLPDFTRIRITFYEGGEKLYKMELYIHEKLLVAQTYNEHETWRFDKRKNNLILYSHHGKTEIVLL